MHYLHNSHQPALDATTATRVAEASDYPRLAACLARSFEADPVLAWLFPDADSRRRHATTFYAAVLQQFFGIGEVSTTPGRDAAAIWQPPNPGRAKLRDELRYALTMIGLLRSRAMRARELLNAMERVHYRGPHWYLAILGTEPESRRMGMASALLEPTLRQCDRERLPAYLESSNEANLPFYRRHGFEIVARIAISDGPTLWPMLRQPQDRWTNEPSTPA